MSDKKTPGGIDTDLVRDLAKVLAEQGLTEIEVEHGELRLRLARTVQAAPAPAAYAPAPAAAAPAQAPAPAAPTAKDYRTDPRAVVSPMVGTAYLSPEPGSAVFVKVGDTVTEGQTLLIVEAMKTFNPIAAPRAGKVVQLIVADAQPVEYGEPLLLLE
ncbi:MAG: acetyl-CoA carboxylase biotin carboxyl carrier protein [Hyphomonadaceae bacterium]|nr:acetyl-CoA carboxylase biotin carboxyl carrier protein [Hyphomonadaceae bacterium]